MDWKSKSPQQKRDKAYPLPLGWIGKTLCLLPAIIGGKFGSDGDHVCEREKPLDLQLYQFVVGYGTLLPITGLALWEREEELRWPAMMGWFFRARSDESSLGEDGVIWI